MLRRPRAARAERVSGELHIYILPHTALVSCRDARGGKRREEKNQAADDVKTDGG